MNVRPIINKTNAKHFSFDSLTALQLDHKNDQLCFHCLEPIPPFTNLSASVDDLAQPMCCMGCKAVTEFIEAQGLSQFYEHRERLDQYDFFGHISHNENNQIVLEHWAFLDDENLSKNYIAIDKSGNREITIFAKGLYCSSCSWLITKALKSVSDKMHINIDVNTKTVKISVEEHHLSIARLLEIITRIGYEPIVAKLGDSQVIRKALKQEQNKSIKRIVVAGFGMMQVMTYAVATYFGESLGIQIDHYRFLVLVSMLVATVVVFYSGKPFFVNAWNDLKNKHLGMDVPIALAISGAYFPSVYQALSSTTGHVYFDSAVMFVFFLLLGRHMEIRVRHRLSGSNTDVQNLLPIEIEVSRVKNNESSQLTLRPNEIQVGDRMQLNANDIVCFDACITNGRVQVDESIINGESLPVDKIIGDSLVAGSMVVSGSVAVEASNAWIDSSIARIEKMLQTASMSQECEEVSNRVVSRNFILMVLLLTLLVACFWGFYQPSRVFEVCLAMLIASCPCAFSLAVPIARSAAIHSLRTAGVLLTNNKTLRNISHISTWYFDKTGTLTKGNPTIVDIVVLGAMPSSSCLNLAAAMSKQSDHVLSKAFDRVESNLKLIDVIEVAGCGVTATYKNKQYSIGKHNWVLQNIQSQLNTNNVLDVYQSLHEDASEIWLANHNEVLAVFYVADQLRSSASAAIRQLKTQGNDVIILSGDKYAAVASACQKLPMDHFLSELSPKDKLDVIAKKQLSGQKVLMVGDGINDSPVLAKADVSVAMASGSELSQNNADVILINGDLTSLSLLKPVANKTIQVTRQNTYWAIIYNLVVLPLAAFGMLSPWIAAIGMSLSSLLVMLNSLRISRTVKMARKEQCYSVSET